MSGFSAFAGRHLAAALGLVTLCMSASGCTVQSVDSHRVASSDPAIPATQKITDLKVAFDPTPPRQFRIVSSGRGYAAPPSVYEPQARQLITNFERLFARGFAQRFAQHAIPYGVSLSPAAPNILRLKIAEITVHCSGNCVTRAQLGGNLYGPDGRPMWVFNSNVGQATIFSSVSDDMFDALARELLEAMKKDGVIGK
jgi:hypothetical protein